VDWCNPTDLISTSMAYQHGTAVLAISGEIDIATAHAVEHAVAEVPGEDPPFLVIDVLGVEFLASVGIGILVKARNKFDNDGCNGETKLDE
jgi:anti-sigma B factor antagonist